MQTIVGIDNRKRLRRLGVFSDGIDEAGEIAARDVIRDTDILFGYKEQMIVPAGFVVVSLPALPVGYIYKVSTITSFYNTGVCAMAYLYIIHGGNTHYFSVTPAWAINVSLEFRGQVWATAGDLIGVLFNTTSGNSNVFLIASYTRHPYLAAGSA